MPGRSSAAGDLDRLAGVLANSGLHPSSAYRDRRRRRPAPLWARAEAAGRSVGRRVPTDDRRSGPADPDGGLGGRPAGHRRRPPDRGARRSTGSWSTANEINSRDDAGHRRSASRLARRLIATLINLGAALWLQGELTAAIDPLAEAVERGRAAGDDAMLQAALGNLGLVRRDIGEIDEASALFTEEERSVPPTRRTRWRSRRASATTAQLLRQRARSVEALALLTEQEAMCRVDRRAGRGDPLRSPGRPRSSPTTATRPPRWPTSRRTGTAGREAGDRPGSAESLLNLGNTLRQLGRRDEALAAAAEAEQLTRRMGDGSLLARVLDGQARVAIDQGRWPDAERLAGEAALPPAPAVRSPRSSWPSARSASPAASSATCPGPRRAPGGARRRHRARRSWRCRRGAGQPGDGRHRRQRPRRRARLVRDRRAGAARARPLDGAAPAAQQPGAGPSDARRRRPGDRRPDRRCRLCRRARCGRSTASTADDRCRIALQLRAAGGGRAGVGRPDRGLPCHGRRGRVAACARRAGVADDRARRARPGRGDARRAGVDLPAHR